MPYIAASPDLAAFYGASRSRGALRRLPTAPMTCSTWSTSSACVEDCASMEVKEYSDPELPRRHPDRPRLRPPAHDLEHGRRQSRPTPAFTAVVQVQSANDIERTTILRTFNEVPGVRRYS